MIFIWHCIYPPSCGSSYWLIVRYCLFQTRSLKLSTSLPTWGSSVQLSAMTTSFITFQIWFIKMSTIPHFAQHICLLWYDTANSVSYGKVLVLLTRPFTTGHGFIVHNRGIQNRVGKKTVYIQYVVLQVQCRSVQSLRLMYLHQSPNTGSFMHMHTHMHTYRHTKHTA